MPRVHMLLAALGCDHRPLTHQILDELPAGQTTEHLRSVLVATGALPVRDERLVALERWITQAIQARNAGDERQILHRYAVWHLLRRLRQRRDMAARRRGRAPDGPAQTTRGQADYVRRHVLAAIAVFDLMRAQGLTLASLTQPDLDRWTAEHRFTYPQQTAHFVRWAVASTNVSGLTPPGGRPASRNAPYPTERRWADARRLLHDANLRLSDRVAGLLVLLYAQSAAAAAGLTAADVHDDGTEVKLTLAAEPIILPQPLAGLMRDLVATRTGHATIGRPGTVPWLSQEDAPASHWAATGSGSPQEHRPAPSPRPGHRPVRPRHRAPRRPAGPHARDQHSHRCRLAAGRLR